MKPLSPNNRLNALLFPFVSLFLSALLLVIGTFSWNIYPIVCTLYCLVMIVWTYFAAIETYDLHYDDEFLYLKRIGRKVTIPLSAIKTIQRTDEGMKVVGVTAWLYVIRFHATAEMVDQTVYEPHGSRRVAEFVEVVRRRNDGVIIHMT